MLFVAENIWEIKCLKNLDPNAYPDQIQKVIEYGYETVLWKCFEPVYLFIYLFFCTVLLRFNKLICILFKDFVTSSETYLNC